jgi:hypothetical protein
MTQQIRAEKETETKRMVTGNDAFKTGQKGSAASSLFHRC